ncbi:MAG: hypothetical protein KF715_15585 [Candidatus Didemnitutus sp.]|nr:hypothetical protein [Candidatus Didemnitutus sp.]
MNLPHPTVRLFHGRADFSEAAAKIAGPGEGREGDERCAETANFLIRWSSLANGALEIVGTGVAFCRAG